MQVDREIGQAIRDYGIDRSEVFISTKIWPNFYAPDAVEICCDKILAGMEVDYVDCLLLHWPCAFKPISFEALKTADAHNQADMKTKGMDMTEDGKMKIDWQYTSEPIAKAGGHPEGSIVPTWNAMKELVKKGKTRAIGVSNFGIADLKCLLPHAQDVPIAVNQVEAHPWFPNTNLVSFHKENKIITSCFSPFAGQKADGKTLIHDPTVQKIAKKNTMGVGQLLQSWAVQRGTVPLGKSGNPGQEQISSNVAVRMLLTANVERIKANFAIRRLSDEDNKALDDLEVPNNEGRSIEFSDAWGVKLWQE